MGKWIMVLIHTRGIRTRVSAFGRLKVRKDRSVPTPDGFRMCPTRRFRGVEAVTALIVAWLSVCGCPVWGQVDEHAFDDKGAIYAQSANFSMRNSRKAVYTPNVSGG